MYTDNSGDLKKINKAKQNKNNQENEVIALSMSTKSDRRVRACNLWK